MSTAETDFDAAVLLTYLPKQGAENDGYADWIQRYDNPFFNSVPGIVRYTNWKIVGSHGNVPYGYFDILGLQDLASFERVWSGDEVRAFTAKWRDRWGADPGTDSDLNSHVYLCERTSGKSTEWTDYVVFGPGSNADRAGAGFEEWRVLRSIKGDLRFQNFVLKYEENPEAFERWREDKPALSPAILGHCFAAPE